MRLFDSHCHLDEETWGGPEAVAAVLARARAAGVDRLVAVGAGGGLAGARDAVGLAARERGVWAAVGLHPHEARLWDRALAAELAGLLDRPGVVALGEIGLDFHYDFSPRDRQRDALRAQVALALERGLPIVVHDRESDGETLRVLVEEGAFEGAGVLYHCFTGDVAGMEEVVARGGHVSLSGIVTFNNAGALREVAQRVPLDRLLVETDSPYLSPAPHRGKRNEPARVRHVVEKVAELRGLGVDEVADATAANAARFFRLEAAA